MSDAMHALSLWLIPGCPLAAAILVALFGKAVFRSGSHRVVVGALIVSCVLSLWQWGAVAFGSAPREKAAPAAAEPAPHAVRTAPIAYGFEWIPVGRLNIRADVQVDALSAVMLAMVTLVSTLVAIYASGYMHGDPGYARFFAELALFVFSMCMLVMARNFLVLFIFWEAVGLCSYLLVGFWFERPSAAAAAVKAFVVNRIGDAAFLIGLYLIWTTFGSLDFQDVFSQVSGNAGRSFSPGFSQHVLLICMCLFTGACGKSAQFPLHLWLPDAMEGPSPVSALIHAATMVTAGVYLVARCTPLFVLAPEAQLTVAIIGGITALLAALIALTQNDLKRVLAYSTVSQLGYMFLALGSAAAGPAFATAAVTAAIFHLFTHAFFKALLFLAAGNVMHSMGNVIDMRYFGGLRKVLPVTHITFLCGAGALSGFPFLSGFWSKDEIFGLLRNGTYHGDHRALFLALFWVAIATAVLTAFYTFRAYYMTFFGPTRIPREAFEHAHHGASDSHGAAADAHGGHLPVPIAAAHADETSGNPADIHEGPAAMKWPLVVLAVFAVGVGLVVGPTGLFAGWIAQVPTLTKAEPEAFNWLLAGGSILAVLAGIGVAAWMYARPSNRPQLVRAAFGPLYTLSLNKFYLDEIANALVVFPVKALAFISLLFDQGLVDRLVDEVGIVPGMLGRFLRPVQNGLIQSYALVMLFGLAIFLTTILQLVPFH
ncbi:MAG TPA: NADH-quinone oxidoreductase subunit L [Planctomycetaceae bacterium]|jgi:NADH-quinone oxidoreductase subunit L|nr:NADH-quinone oxidoreductase subunit L [Planctomycetaceae bacterium]